MLFPAPLTCWTMSNIKACACLMPAGFPLFGRAGGLFLRLGGIIGGY